MSRSSDSPRDIESVKRAFQNSHLQQQPYDEGAASTPPVQSRTLGFSATFSGNKKQSMGALAAAGRFSSSFTAREQQSPADNASPSVNPRVAQALKEITTSPSPKVSALVEQIKEKVKKNEAAAQRSAQLHMHRSALLAEAAKIRAVRKKWVEAAESELRLAEMASKESGDRLQVMKERAAAARHTANELQRRSSAAPTTLYEAQGLADREEAALAEAQNQHRARLAEEQRARAAAEAAEAQHQDAVRNEEQVQRSSEALAEEEAEATFSPMSGGSQGVVAMSPAEMSAISGLQLDLSSEEAMARSMALDDSSGAAQGASPGGVGPGGVAGLHVGEVQVKMEEKAREREEAEERERRRRAAAQAEEIARCREEARRAEEEERLRREEKAVEERRQAEERAERERKRKEEAERRRREEEERLRMEQERMEQERRRREEERRLEEARRAEEERKREEERQRREEERRAMEAKREAERRAEEERREAERRQREAERMEQERREEEERRAREEEQRRQAEEARRLQLLDSSLQRVLFQVQETMHKGSFPAARAHLAAAHELLLESAISPSQHLSKQLAQLEGEVDELEAAEEERKRQEERLAGLVARGEAALDKGAEAAGREELTQAEALLGEALEAFAEAEEGAKSAGAAGGGAGGTGRLAKLVAEWGARAEGGKGRVKEVHGGMEKRRLMVKSGEEALAGARRARERGELEEAGRLFREAEAVLGAVGLQSRAAEERREALREAGAELRAAEEQKEAERVEKEGKARFRAEGDALVAGAAGAFGGAGDFRTARENLLSALEKYRQAGAGERVITEVEEMLKKVEEGERVALKREEDDRRRRAYLHGGQRALEAALEALSKGQAGGLQRAKDLVERARVAFSQVPGAGMEEEVQKIAQVIEEAEADERRERARLAEEERRKEEERKAEERRREEERRMEEERRQHEQQLQEEERRAAEERRRAEERQREEERRKEVERQQAAVVRGEGLLGAARDKTAANDFDGALFSLQEAHAAFKESGTSRGREAEVEAMFGKVAEAKQVFAERQRLQEEEERGRRRAEEERRRVEEDSAEGAMSLRGAIEAWEGRDRATASHLFDRAENAFRRAGKIQEAAAVVEERERVAREEEERAKQAAAEKESRNQGRVAFNRGKQMLDGARGDVEKLRGAVQTLRDARSMLEQGGKKSGDDELEFVTGTLAEAEEELAAQAGKEEERRRRVAEADATAVRAVEKMEGGDLERARELLEQAAEALAAAGEWDEEGRGGRARRVTELVEEINRREDAAVRALVQREAAQQEVRAKAEGEQRAAEVGAGLLAEGREALQRGDWAGVRERMEKMEEAARAAGARGETLLREAAGLQAASEKGRVSALRRQVMEGLAGSSGELAEGRYRAARRALAAATGACNELGDEETLQRLHALRRDIDAAEDKAKAAGDVDPSATPPAALRAGSLRGSPSADPQALSAAQTQAPTPPEQLPSPQPTTRALPPGVAAALAAASPESETPPMGDCVLPPGGVGGSVAGRASLGPAVVSGLQGAEAAGSAVPRPVPELSPLPMPPGAQRVERVERVERVGSSDEVLGTLTPRQAPVPSALEPRVPEPAAPREDLWETEAGEESYEIPSELRTPEEVRYEERRQRGEAPLVSPDRWGGPLVDPLRTPSDDRHSFGRDSLGIRVSVMGEGRGSPNDRLVGTWMADDGARSKDEMEEVLGGLLGSANMRLASLRAQWKRQMPFDPSLRVALEPKDLNILAGFATRVQQKGDARYDFWGEGGMYHLLDIRDPNLVAAYREFEFHKEDGMLLDRLIEIQESYMEC